MPSRKLSVPLMVLLLATHTVRADPVTFDKDGVTGSVDKVGDAMEGRAVVVVARPVDTVLAGLTDYAHLGDWLPQTLEYWGKSTGGLNGRFYRKSKAPPLLSDPYATCEATAERLPNGGANVRWHRVEGSIQKFEALYTLEPLPNGSTRVTYTVTTVPPFAIPGFLLKRVAPNAIADTLRGLRRHVLAMPAPAPAPAAPPPVDSAGDAGTPNSPPRQ